jgi:tetratricopeptide (TPR) repeat protein
MFMVTKDMDRLEMLREIVAQQPNDAFARYGLAMELGNRGELESAMTEFKKLLEMHPDYAAGYFMAAQQLAKAGRTDEAKEHLRRGIAAAQRTRNSHAAGEMQAMLDELEA